jgi:IS5 family transposase
VALIAPVYPNGEGAGRPPVGLDRMRRNHCRQHRCNLTDPAVNAQLAEQGFKVSAGTIFDATIISAPSSTKNRDGKRDPEMHQTKNGNE